jgi:pimeloyl-ACP methyl ester carboxylesterase
MKANEAQALSRLTAQAVAGTVSHIEQVHTAAARRAFGVTLGAFPARAVHDAVAGGIYGGVRTGMLAAGEAASGVVGLLARPAGQPIGSTTPSNAALAALNAAVGDRLVADDSPLAITMALRVGGSDVSATREILAAEYPDASSKVVVFLHGLGETENAWRRHAEQHHEDKVATYGSRLADELGFSPLYVRFNTGLHISENGRRLSRLLTDVLAAWPRAIDEVVLIGHSMGGLVARSACHYGADSNEPWVPLVRDAFYLGSPHLGAPLERLVGFVGWALSKSSQARPWVTLVSARSAGVKDLRFGYILDDDWRGCDPDTCLEDHRHDVPLLATANHYMISATVTTDPDHPLGRILGDLLVQPASAHGRRRHIRLEVDDGYRLGGAHHFDLLNHEAIYKVIRTRLDH